jgi:hypothetical protein
MDVMHMDERQRLHWLKANRATLMTVGVGWLLWIGFELIEGRTPWSLIWMVPTVAAVRLGFYWFYARDRDVLWRERLLFFVLVGAGHFIATIAAQLGEFSTSGLFGIFPEPGHTAWSATVRVLEFPLVTLSRGSGTFETAAYGWMMILNSALWAGVISAAVWALRRKRDGTRTPELGVSH